MRVNRNLIFVFFLFFSLLGFQEYSNSNHLQDVKIKNLLHASLDKEFAPDREVLIDLVEFPPDTKLEKHWHPGEEFHYYLDGEVEIKIDGESSIKGTPGIVGHVPFQKHHTAITGKNGARVLVFRVHSKGEPIRYIEDKEEKK